MSGPRHKWSPAWRPSDHKTERTCVRCGLIKVTRHEFAGAPGERHWTEWWRPAPDASGEGGGVPVRIHSDPTPACAPATAEETMT